jgi:hypothetical protein
LGKKIHKGLFSFKWSDLDIVSNHLLVLYIETILNNINFLGKKLKVIDQVIEDTGIFRFLLSSVSYYTLQNSLLEANPACCSRVS